MYNTNYMNTKVARRLSPGEERLLAFKGISEKFPDALGRAAQLGGSGFLGYKGLSTIGKSLSDPSLKGIATLGLGALGTGLGLYGSADAVTGDTYALKQLKDSIANRFDRDNLVGVSDPAQVRGIPNLSGYGLDAVSKGSFLEGLIPGIGRSNLGKSVTDEMDRREKVKEDAAKGLSEYADKLQMGKDLGQQASPFMDKLLESVPFTSQRARAAKEERDTESLYGMFSDMASGEGAKDYKPESKSKSEPTNFADYIMNNPGKSALGAGLGSALVYNALGGREGIQEKLEAVRKNPGATAAGLGSLGVLSAATYDAMREKNSNDTNPDTRGILSILKNFAFSNPQNEGGKSDLETKSQGEGNLLASADKGIDTTIDYLPYILGAGGLAGAGYGGYKLVDYLKDKKESREKKAIFEPFYTPEEEMQRRSYLGHLGKTVLPTTIGAAVGGGALFGGLPEYARSKSILRALASSLKPAAYTAPLGAGVSVLGGIANVYNHNSKIDDLEEAELLKNSAHGRAHESKFTKEYDRHPSLVGKQKNLPDMIQKKIVDSHSKKAAHRGSPEHKYTQEYNHHSRLQGKQKTDLPDFLQKEIIDSRSKSAKFLQGLYS